MQVPMFQASRKFLERTEMMRRRTFSVAVTGTVCLAAAIFAAPGRRSPSRRFEFTYHAAITNLPPQARRVRVWIPVAGSDAHQAVKLEKVSAPAGWRLTREPEYGDRMIYVELHNPSSRDAEFTLKYLVTRREYSKGDFQQLLEHNSDPSPEPARLRRFLEPDRLVPVEGQIKTLADRVAGGKQGPVEKAHAIYDYIFRTLRYDKSGTGWGRGDAVWACDARHGNCTDFHSLFIAMMRAEGVPARFAIGFPLAPSARDGTIPGYHCWAEFYLEGAGWVPVDISEAWLDKKKYAYYFGTVDANRMRFSLGRDINLVPRQSGPPVNYFVYPYAEVDGKPFAGVEKNFTFRDAR
jgi:transglutaminase-like putative cysteine protease